MKQEQSKIKRDILKRVKIVYGIFIFVGFIILMRLIFVQVFSSETRINAERLQSRIFMNETTLSQRGGVLARNGEPLAVSLFRYNVDFDFGSTGLDSLKTFNEQSDSLSKLLSLFFRDKSAAAYKKLFRDKHSRHYRLTNRRDTTYHRSESSIGRFFDRMRSEEFITHHIYDTIRDHTPTPIFPRNVDYNEWRELSKYPILNWNMGMVYHLNKIEERVHPHGELARRTIGLSDEKGQYGIESVYDETLDGEDGVALRQRIARGFYGRVVGGEGTESINGSDIITTIDINIQDFANTRLKAQLINQNAIWGTTIVMEVETGELHALVNLGRNSRGEYVENMNYAIGKRAELGSVLKLATMLALVEDGEMPTSTVYDTQDGKRVIVEGTAVQDAHDGYHEMDFKTAVAQSSNVYFGMAVNDIYKDNRERYTDFLASLNLNKRVGFEAFGEPAPLFPDWKMHGAKQALVRLSFGYIAELTPLQMVTLYNAVANDGEMVAPQLIREIRRGSEVVEEFEPTILVDKISSNRTLKIVKESLEEVYRTGSVARLFRDTTQFRVAGKTGTAQYSQDGIKYSDGYYIGSMVGYFPVKKPRYTVMTTIFTKRQSGRAYYGGPLAGPVVRDVIYDIYNSQFSNEIESSSKILGNYHPEYIKGGDIKQIREVADEFSTKTIYEDKSGWGRVEVDTLSRVTITTIKEDVTKMPDVRGMGLKDALFMLESRGLRVSFKGKGRVTHQSIGHGAAIRRGNHVAITLK